MKTKLKIHKALLCIHSIIFMSSFTLAWVCLFGIKYTSINNATLIIIAISQLVISAYSAHMGILYEKSVERIKRKLGK